MMFSVGDQVHVGGYGRPTDATKLGRVVLILSAGESLYAALRARGTEPLRSHVDVTWQGRYLVEVTNRGKATYYAPRCSTVDSQERKRREAEAAKKAAEKRSVRT